MAQLHTLISSEFAAVLASPKIVCWVNAKARIMAEAYKIYSSHRRARQLAARGALADASAAESTLRHQDPDTRTLDFLISRTTPLPLPL